MVSVTVFSSHLTLTRVAVHVCIEIMKYFAAQLYTNSPTTIWARLVKAAVIAISRSLFLRGWRKWCQHDPGSGLWRGRRRQSKSHWVSVCLHCQTLCHICLQWTLHVCLLHQHHILYTLAHLDKHFPLFVPNLWKYCASKSRKTVRMVFDLHLTKFVCHYLWFVCQWGHRRYGIIETSLCL